MTKRERSQFKISLASLCISIGLLSCQSRARENSLSASIPSSSPSSSNQDPKSSEQSAIRKIDFSNFQYDVAKSSSAVTLIDGKSSPKHAGVPNESETYLQSIAYDDVNRDGIEDAIVVLGIISGGSAIPHHVYLYTIDRNGPELLWNFTSGDRADGGLRKVYADHGGLVVELYGKDRIIGTPLYRSDGGDCCPDYFTRTRYSWNGKQFVQQSAEILTNTDSGAPLLMKPYSHGDTSRIQQ